MLPRLRDLLEGYRRIGVWSGRALVSLLCFAVLALVVVWPLWALATQAPLLYALLVATLLLAALAAGLLRRRRRKIRDADVVPRRRGAKLKRIGASVVAVGAAYAALVLMQSGAVAAGALLALLALVALGIAGQRLARK